MLISDLSDTQLAMLVLPILPNMWSLKHVFHHDFPTEKEKMRWLLACVFLPCIGGLAYIFVGRRHASKEKIDVFERYGKKNEEQSAQPETEAPAEHPAAVAAASVETFDDPLPEDRARAPWDDDVVAEPVAAADKAPAFPAEEAEAEKTPEEKRPGVRDWDFGCPDDARKN